ncbi:unnamed protein product [Owenia fusiformis]|uniref:Polypeptide N-acetylgalactosaminyltransferase n=1 Tax=Owenia fusiformis TaxID=6347 RepID=A0A8J1XVA1_OWEFU|nr:unnamed protein product [Owenia fusiformis]
MRFTIKFLAKCLVAIVLLIFIGPYLMGQLDSDEKKRSNQLTYKKRSDIHKRYQEEKNERNKLQNDQKLVNALKPPEAHVNLNPVLDSDAEVEHMQQAPPDPNQQNVLKEVKQYGPKAVFKDGILGNYEPKNIPQITGPGEGGEPVYISMAEKAQGDRSTQEFGFNMVASDKISMTRRVPDTRMDECKYWDYPSASQLPKASVILVFHNEGWSTLVRTVHSIINMSPKELLHEIVMVDDFSDKPHLKDKLAEYLKQFDGLVKLFRNTKREGLIMTRTLGAKYSTGEVIIFLDAHCECNYNWLPPLLARIAYDRTIMAVPIVDGIDWDNFRYAPVYSKEHFRGIFEWGFLYKESRVPDRELNTRAHDSEPYKAPTHAGGLFAMDRKYFFEMGAYDEGMQIWGGENFELSFKLWQCGGSIEWVPCSRVGHVYRNHMPYGFGDINPKIPVILLNYMRVVEVWLDDEFKEYFYTREPTIRGYDIGDISKQLQFKKDHNCKSFKWFMENVAYEVTDKFPYPPPNKAWGEIKLRNGYSCIDTLNKPLGQPIGIGGCHHYGGSQLFRLNVEGQLANGERCLAARSKGMGLEVCPVKQSGPWDWNENTGLIRNKDLNKCVQAIGSSGLELRECNQNESNQQWEIKKIKTW